MTETVKIPDDLRAWCAVAISQRGNWPPEYVVRLIERIARAESALAEREREVERLKAKRVTIPAGYDFRDLGEAQETIDHLETELAALRARCERMEAPVSELLDAMETCHICKGAIVLQDYPTHCETCSYDCEEHDGPACVTVDVLHARIRKAIAARAAAQLEGAEGGTR